MIPLLILSILAIYIFIERAVVIRKAAREDRTFMDRIKDYIHEGDVDAALNLCKKTDTPYARICHNKEEDQLCGGNSNEGHGF